jgi:hypothetical protein
MAAVYRRKGFNDRPARLPPSGARGSTFIVLFYAERGKDLAEFHNKPDYTITNILIPAQPRPTRVS